MEDDVWEASYLEEVDRGDWEGELGRAGVRGKQLGYGGWSESWNSECLQGGKGQMTSCVCKYLINGVNLRDTKDPRPVS